MSDSDADATVDRGSERGELHSVLRVVAMIALLGAAAIHFAYTPVHFDEGTADGLFFIVVAWLQMGAAAALWQIRDRREPWIGAAAISAVVALVWLVSRTVGLPGRDGLDLGWADGVAFMLQVVALVAAVGALLPAVATRPAPRLSPAVGGAAALAVVAGVSVVMVPSVGHNHEHGHDEGHDHGDAELAADGDDHGDHGDGHDHGDDDHGDDDHGDHGDHGDGGEATQLVADDERCDLGFNTATFNATSEQAEPHSHDDEGGGHDVDFTVEEWAEVFVQPVDENPMAVGIESREQVLDFLATDPALEEGVVSGGLAHTLDPDPWLPMTDPEECEALGEELERTRAVAERYPTAQEALDDGYRMVTPYLPSIASHYIKIENTGEFDIDNPGMLLYDGNGPDANIVGISHYLLREGEPEEDFTGPNDHWHRHIGLCMSDEESIIIGGTNLTEEECADRGGTKMDGANQWMNHVWIVPGCESDYGMFSGANPALVARGSTATRDPFDTDENREPIPTGCGSGATLDDDLDVDDPGDGPSIAEPPGGN